MSNNDLVFELDNFRVGTDNQRNVGIFGSFTLNIRNSDGIVVTLDGMRLRRTKNENEWYVEGPYTEYNKADGTKGKQHHFRVWPDRNNSSKRDPIVAQAKQLFEQGGSPKKGDSQPSAGNTASAPRAQAQNAQPAGAAKSTAKDPW